MKTQLLLLILSLGLPLPASAEASAPQEAEPMTQERMEAILRSLAPGAEGVPGSLSEQEIRSAVSQVANLARTFGTTYSSGQLVYGGAKSL